jgi:hypothetical protein
MVGRGEVDRIARIRNFEIVVNDCKKHIDLSSGKILRPDSKREKGLS